MQIKTYSENSNRVLREGNLLWILLFIFLFSFIISLAIICYLFFSNPVRFISSLQTYPLFNFPVTLLIFISTSVFFAYYLYREAQIQFVNKKHYFSSMSQTYKTILSLPISLNFGILLSVFLIHTIYNYYGKIDDEFIYSFVVLLFIFIPTCSYFYHGGIRWLLFIFLKNYERLSFTYSELIENELDFAMKNNTHLSIVLLKIMNIEQIEDEFKKTPKKVVESAISLMKKIAGEKEHIYSLKIKEGKIAWFPRLSKEDTRKILEDTMREKFNKVFEEENVSFGVSFSYQIYSFPDEIKEQSVREILDLLNKTKL